VPGKEPPAYRESDLNWPWFPEDHLAEIATSDFYDYVLVRGKPGSSGARPDATSSNDDAPFSLGPAYERIFVGDAWTVWKKR
jgi:hypothetical protein